MNLKVALKWKCYFTSHNTQKSEQRKFYFDFPRGRWCRCYCNVTDRYNITTCLCSTFANIKNIIKFEMLFLSSFRTFLHISSHNANVLKFLRTLATARNIEHSPFKAFKNYYNKYVRKKMKLCWWNT